MSLISIIIPYYKKKKYIKQTIKSISKQSFKNYEIIIIYDDENKEDLIYLKKLKKEFKKIRIIINNRNIGAGYSRNKGIRFSKGKFIAFLDADDLWLPSKLKIQLNFMKKNNFDISHTSYKIIDEENKLSSLRIAKKLDYNDLLKSCDIGLSTVMINKKILPKNPFAGTKTKEDYILWLKLSQKKMIFHPLKKELTIWRKSKNSLSSSISQKLLDGFFVYKVFLKQNSLRALLNLMVLSFNYLRK